MTAARAAVLPARGSGRARRPRSSRSFWHFHDAATDATATVHCRSAATARGRATTPPSSLPFYWRAYKPTAAGAPACSRCLFFGSNAGTQPRGRLPAVLALPTSADQSTTTALLPLFYWHRDRNGYALGDAARCCSWATTAARATRSSSRCSGTSPASATARPPPSRRSATTTRDPRRLERRRRPAGAAAVRALREDALALRAGAALLALRRPDRRQDDHRRRALLAPDAGATRPPTRSSRCSTTGAARARAAATRPASRCFPLVHYRRDANTRVLVDAARRVGAAGPNRSGGFVGPYIWYDDKDLSLRFIPFLHIDVTRHDTGERTAPVRPLVPDRRARAHARACCSRSSAATRRAGDATPGSFPTLLPACAATTATASTRSCRSTGGRRSATGRRPSSASTTIAPRPASTTSASCRSSSTRATRSAASPSSRRCSPYRRNEHDGEQRLAVERCSTSTSTTANRA